MTFSGDWTTFARQIPAGLNFSITGIPYWTTDTGGFFHPRDQYASPDYNELLTRWFEWSTFCPILRIHGCGTATEIWNWLPATQTNLIAFDKLRYRMLPYNYSVAWKITSEGYTPMRALVMDFPKDRKALAIGDEYMFGPAFLVCPVTKPQATTRAVYLPSGANWVDFWTGETAPRRQDRHRQRARQHHAAVCPRRFNRAARPGDAIRDAETGGSRLNFGSIAARTASSRFTRMKTTTTITRRGEYATIPFTWNEAEQTLTIGKRSGKFPGMLKERTFRVVFVSPGHGDRHGGGIPGGRGRSLHRQGGDVPFRVSG